MPAPKRITFLITDLLLGGAPRWLRDLTLGLAHPPTPTPTPSALSTQHAALPPHPALTPHPTPDTRHPTPLHISVISLKPLPPSTQDSGLRTQDLSIPDQLRAANIPVHSLNITSPAAFATAPFRLARLLNRLQPDILYAVLVHANALAALTLPLLSPRPKCIQSLHTLQDKPAWHWTLQGLIAPFCDALIAPAQPILDRISTHGPFPRGHVIPYGIDTDRFAHPSPHLPPPTLPWPPGSQVVGYVGRFDPVKNLPLLLRALALLIAKTPSKNANLPAHNPAYPHLSPQNALPNLPKSPIHLALLGYGPQESELKALSETLQITENVHFLGPSPYPELYYKHFSCLALPSTAEGFGLILVEAMAANTPVLAMNTPVIRSIVRHQIDGLLLPPPPTPDKIAQALAALLSESPHQPPSLTPLSPPAAISDPKTPLSSPAYAAQEFSLLRMIQRHREFFQNF